MEQTSEKLDVKIFQVQGNNPKFERIFFKIRVFRGSLKAKKAFAA